MKDARLRILLKFAQLLAQTLHRLVIRALIGFELQFDKRLLLHQSLQTQVEIVSRSVQLSTLRPQAIVLGFQLCNSLRRRLMNRIQALIVCA